MKGVQTERKSDIIFKDYSNTSKQDWDGFAEKCDEAWLWHGSVYIDVNIGNSDWKNQSFSIVSGNGIIGLCVLGLTHAGFGRVLSGPGLAVAKEFKNNQLFHLVEAEIARRARASSCIAVVFSISAAAPAMWRERYATSYLSTFPFSYGSRGATGEYEGGYHLVASLERTEEQILKSYTKGNIAAVKKCYRLALVVQQIERIDDRTWSEFVDMYMEMCRRRVATPWSRNWLEFLKRQTERGHFLLFNSYHEGKICASILLACYKGAIVYYAAGCTEDALSLGAMVHLHYEAMKAAKKMGVKYYILGSRIPVYRYTDFDKLSKFKANLSNERWDMLNGEWVIDRRKYVLLFVLPNLVRSTLLGVPIFKAMTKRILYVARHIPVYIRGKAKSFTR